MKKHLLLTLAVTALSLAGPARSQESVKKIPASKTAVRFAIGDIHGDYKSFVKLLGRLGLIDQKLKWTGGKKELVQTGDIFDRGPGSRAAVELLMKLEGEAKKAGGEATTVEGTTEAYESTLDHGLGFPTIDFPDLPGTYHLQEVRITGLDPERDILHQSAFVFSEQPHGVLGVDVLQRPVHGSHLQRVVDESLVGGAEVERNVLAGIECLVEGGFDHGLKAGGDARCLVGDNKGIVVRHLDLDRFKPNPRGCRAGGSKGPQ